MRRACLRRPLAPRSPCSLSASSPRQPPGRRPGHRQDSDHHIVDDAPSRVSERPRSAEKLRATDARRFYRGRRPTIPALRSRTWGYANTAGTNRPSSSKR